MSSYLSQFNFTIFESSAPAYSAETSLIPQRWVFLHGLMGYGLNWRTIAKNICESPGQQTLIYDQRGHGQSMKPATGYAPEDYAKDLFLITEELGWSQFILVGHSMGARNALVFASLYPEKVSRLVMEDMGPENDPGAIDYYRNILGVIPTPFVSKKAAREFFNDDFPRLTADLGEPPTLGAYLYTNIIENTDGTAEFRFSKEAMISTVIQGRATDHWHQFRRLPMPVLVVRGETSKELPRPVFDKMCVSLPQVTGVEIQGAGHWVHADKPKEFLSEIKKFAALL